ncbi:hypothetical protein BN871_EM_00120 [Paenibacillus sp. P22]|nr:hypothetical protein BN871_EM_00120 [Paenibacillus sp. P22]
MPDVIDLQPVQVQPFRQALQHKRAVIAGFQMAELLFILQEWI